MVCHSTDTLRWKLPRATGILNFMPRRDLPDLLDQPIVVIGAPRSGTTLLGNLLGAHPLLAQVEEPRLTWKYGNDRKPDMLRAEDARPEVCQHIRQAFAAAVQAAGRQRLLEKTPSNALRMEFVERVLPGCIFVHTIRDGIESVLSIRRYWQQHAHGLPKEKLWERIRELSPRRAPHYLKEFLRRALPQSFAGVVGKPVWGPRIPGIDSLLNELDLLEICCLQWRMCVEQACSYGRALAPGRYMECRLEDMSPQLLHTVLDFCQLNPVPEVDEGFRQMFDKNLTTRAQNEASAEDLATIERWIGPTLTWLGQSPAHTMDAGH